MKLALVAVLIVGGLPAADAADSPARLREDDKSIERTLRVPDGLEPGRYDVHCEVRLKANGKPFDVTCYALETVVPRTLVTAVRRAGRAARYIPAMHDGKPAQVYMLLMVRIVIAKGEPLVLVLPNNGIEHMRYGLFYIAPQRFNVFTWDPPWGWSGEKTLVWQELSIDEQGNVTDSKVTNASGASDAVVDAVRASMAKMKFMPGRVDGKPVPMRYVEPAFSF